MTTSPSQTTHPISVLAEATASADAQSGACLDVVSAALRRAIANIPMLREVYGERPRVDSWNDWFHLPTTELLTYDTLVVGMNYVSGVDATHSPVGPLDLSRPGFAKPVMYSEGDYHLAGDRFLHMLGQIKPDPNVLTIVANDQSRYAASDIGDLLIDRGHRYRLILCSSDPNNAVQRLQALHPKVILWMLKSSVSKGLLPDSCKSVITLNGTRVSAAGVRHTRMLHFDFLPYFAVSRVDPEFSVVPNQFLLEASTTSELLVTTLAVEAMPLVRFRTGLTVDLLSQTHFAVLDADAP